MNSLNNNIDLLSLLKKRLDVLFSENIVIDFESFLSKEYCMNTFGLKEALLIESCILNENLYKILGKYYKINDSILDNEKIDYLLDWISHSLQWSENIDISQIHKNEKLIKIYVAYSWAPDVNVSRDSYWISIRDYFKPTVDTLNKRLKKNNFVASISRLRSSHGDFIHKQIFDKIKDADFLIFDLGQSLKISELKVCREKGKKFIPYTRFNYNVLYELGISVAMNKDILILCPENLKKLIPSDLSNYMFSFYKAKFDNKSESNLIEYIKRDFEDNKGLRSYFYSKLYSISKNLK